MINLKQLENEVKLLMTEQDYVKAYGICKQILEYDAENGTFIRLRNKIEKLVEEKNKKSIKEELNKLEPLLAAENYEDYLTKISEFKLYTDKSPEIDVKIDMAKNLLEKKYLKRQKEEISSLEHDLKSELTDAKISDIQLRLEVLLKLKVNMEKVKALQEKFRQAIIEHELKINQGLLNSKKFEEILLFLTRLDKIDPNNPKIHKLIAQTKENYYVYKLETQKDFIFKTGEEIKTLLIKKNYDQAMELCEKILEIDPKNSFAKSSYETAAKLARKVSEKEIYRQIKSNFKTFPDTSAYKKKQYERI